MNGEPGRNGEVGPRGLVHNFKSRNQNLFLLILHYRPPGTPGQCPNDCYQAMTQANALYYNRVQGNQKGP